jgi:hypothetical protein
MHFFSCGDYHQGVLVIITNPRNLNPAMPHFVQTPLEAEEALALQALATRERRSKAQQSRLLVVDALRDRGLLPALEAFGCATEYATKKNGGPHGR